MSTRSGKRIHISNHEIIVTTEPKLELKSEKKSRSKRLKENDAQLDTTGPKLKQRNNYVTYPAEDEAINEVDASEAKNTRRNLRKTLREHNITVPAIETTDSTEETKKSTRLTRRTKKFAENVENAPESNGVMEVVIPIPTEKTKKKRKKKKSSNEKDLKNGDVPAKKSKKKKKQKKTIINNKEKKLNETGTSVDSFHSAAGSPTKEEIEIGNETDDSVSQQNNSQKCVDTFETNTSVIQIVKSTIEKKRKSSINKKLNGTYDNDASPIGSPVLNDICDKDPNKRKSSIKNSTFDKAENSFSPKLSNGKNSTFDKIEPSSENSNLNSTFEVEPTRKSLRLSKDKKDSTFEKTPQKSKPTSLNSTFDKQPRKLDSTFDKTESHKNSKSSLVSSDDGTVNVTFDKSDEHIHISVTSDESTENIVNTTPVLIESSIDESKMSLSPENAPKKSESPDKSSEVQEKPPPTLLKREGTFTKDGPDPIMIQTKSKTSEEKTPTKRMSLALPGSTPFPTRSSRKSVLNVTRSIEKRRSSIADTAPRQTRVMFCSPVNNPALLTQQKKKVIKSSMKGSNKSFLFDDSVNMATKPAARKRSYTQSDADDTCVKRKRLADDMQLSVNRLSRPRTCSANAKLDSTTPTKKPATPYKRSESKPSAPRTKLPNFAALHQKEFNKMESLDECQERKAKRAKQLLTPTRPCSPKVRTEPKPAKKTETPTKPKPETVFKPKLPTLESLRPGFTRFGFRMNTENNPFSIPSKVEVGPKEIKPKNKLKPLPSSAGATSTRREVAKKTVLREKSFTSLSGKRDETRKENRTVIKGVRTNRRFELQMRSRNMS